jgi:hypothetical protein
MDTKNDIIIWQQICNLKNELEWTFIYDQLITYPYSEDLFKKCFHSKYYHICEILFLNKYSLDEINDSQSIITLWLDNKKDFNLDTQTNEMFFEYYIFNKHLQYCDNNFIEKYKELFFIYSLIYNQIDNFKIIHHYINLDFVIENSLIYLEFINCIETFIHYYILLEKPNWNYTILQYIQNHIKKDILIYLYNSNENLTTENLKEYIENNLFNNKNELNGEILLEIMKHNDILYNRKYIDQLSHYINCYDCFIEKIEETNYKREEIRKIYCLCAKNNYIQLCIKLFYKFKHLFLYSYIDENEKTALDYFLEYYIVLMNENNSINKENPYLFFFDNFGNTNQVDLIKYYPYETTETFELITLLTEFDKFDDIRDLAIYFLKNFNMKLNYFLSDRFVLPNNFKLYHKIFFETYPELLFTDKFSKYIDEYIDKVNNSYVSILKLKHLFKFIYSPDLLLKYTFISHKDYLDLILKFEN